MSKSPELLKQIVFSKGKDGYKWKELLNCLITFPEEIQSFKFVYIQELHQSADDVKALLVDVIDYLMDYGNDEMRSNFALKVFVVAFAQTLKITKSESIVNLILGIIKKWADNVNYRERYPNFAAMYNNLVKNNIQFPNNYMSRYQMYVPQEQNGNGNGGGSGSNNNFIFLQNEELFNFNESNIGGNNMQQVYPNEPFGNVNGNESINLNERSKRYLINDNNNNNNGFNFDFPQQQQQQYNQQNFNQNVISNSNNNKNAQSDYDYAESVKLSLNPNHYPSQYTHIVNDMLIYVDNISLANQMIDNRDESDNDIIREIIGILRNGNNKLIQLVGNDQVHNEELVSNILAITEDINRTMIRWEYFSIGKKPEPFLSVFVENNAKDDVHHHHQQQQQQHPQPKVPVQNQYQPPQQQSQSLNNDLIDLFEDAQPSKDHPLDMFGNDDDDDNFNNQHHFNLRSEQVKQMPLPQQQQQFDMFNFNGLPNSGFQGYPQEPSYNQQQQPYPQHPSINNNNNNNQMNYNQWDMNQFHNFSQQ